MKASEYFLSLRPDSGSERVNYTRIANALSRFCDITMSELCETPAKELKKVRNLGPKSNAIVMDECRKYLKIKDETETGEGKV